MAIIHDTDADGVKVFELETEEGFQNFRRGVDDHRYWRNQEETQELHTFRNANIGHAKLFVKYGDFSQRIK